MSTLAIARDDGQLTDGANPEVKKVRDRIREAREHRKKYEGIWHSNLAWAAGKHWLVWDTNSRVLRRIQDVNPAYRNRELYSVDLITEYRTTVLGELGSDDDRPELLLHQDDETAEDFQAQVNKALGYGWDFEFDADVALAEADRLCLDLGTSAIRCRFDPTKGKPRPEQVPFYQGKPILKEEDARALFSEGPRPDVTLQQINEGRITWEPLSAFNILPPPGITHERYFPWEAIIVPLPLSKVRDEYGSLAGGLEEDKDIGSTLGEEMQSGSSAQSYATGEARESRLRDHVWVVVYYERPTGRRPEGRVYHFASNDLKLMRVEQRLPYEAPDGTYRSGISYFHWWRVSGRFWSRALVENLKDPQKAYNKRATQENEIIDRGLPYVLAAEGTQVEREGTPMEIVRHPREASVPTPVAGIGPGSWMGENRERIQLDMERASGVRGPSMGENPINVANYSQLQLLKQSDLTKRQPMMVSRKLAISQLVEDSVYDMRTYWGPEKQLMLAGDDEKVEASVFNATKIPAFFIVKVAKGAPLVRDQAAELQKIQDIAQYALNAATPLPVDWYKESIDVGEAQELPEMPANEQYDKAQLENHLLLAGQDVMPAYYDPLEVHVPVHRNAQIQCELTGDAAGVLRIEAHVQDHLLLAKQNAMYAAAETQPTNGAPPAPAPTGGAGAPQA
jgi:hypothetical protein